MRFLATMGKCECIDALNDQSFADVLCIYELPQAPEGSLVQKSRKTLDNTATYA